MRPTPELGSASVTEFLPSTSSRQKEPRSGAPGNRHAIPTIAMGSPPPEKLRASRLENESGLLTICCFSCTYLCWDGNEASLYRTRGQLWMRVHGLHIISNQLNLAGLYDLQGSGQPEQLLPDPGWDLVGLLLCLKVMSE